MNETELELKEYLEGKAQEVQDKAETVGIIGAPRLRFGGSILEVDDYATCYFCELKVALDNGWVQGKELVPGSAEAEEVSTAMGDGHIPATALSIIFNQVMIKGMADEMRVDPEKGIQLIKWKSNTILPDQRRFPYDDHEAQARLLSFCLHNALRHTKFSAMPLYWCVAYRNRNIIQPYDYRELNKTMRDMDFTLSFLLGKRGPKPASSERTEKHQGCRYWPIYRSHCCKYM